MHKMSIFWRDLRIVIQAIWLNMVFFACLLAAAVVLMRFTGVYPKASWLDLLVNAFHMAITERVAQPGDGILPDLLTFVLPFFSVIILGEGALRVLSVFVARGKRREEWDRMVAKSFTNHIVICGVGELGRALVKNLLVADPASKMVLVDPKPGVLAEMGLDNPNICHIASDMTNLVTLEDANCQKARLIILSSGSDSSNLEAAFKAIQLNPGAEIWVRLYRRQLADLLDITKKPNIHFFCPYQSAAEELVAHLQKKDG